MRRTAAQKSLRGLRREEVVAAARALVAGRGLEGLTFAALEKELGYSRGVITYHFRDKEEIVEEVLQSALAEIDADTSQEVARAEGFEEKIRAVLRSKLRGFTGSREATTILLSFWGRLAFDKRARKLNAQLFAGYREQSRALIEAGQKAGVLAADADPQALGALLVGTVIGLATQAWFDEGAIDLDRALDEAAQAFSARLRRSSN